MADHLSIGEVLSLLQTDFPEVTISKIRFLESQGLIDPERTPSGYRKFADHDIDVLEWILRQQRDHFLPLRVIRERIDRGDHLVEIADQAAPTSADPADANDALRLATVSESAASSSALDTSATQGAVAAPRSSPLAAELASLSMTADELSAASGLSLLELQELETYGLLISRSLGPARYFDGEALLVAKAAKEFGEHGVEPRHLRMFRTAAEREASVFEQAVMAVLQQRRPDARAEARAALERLAVLGERLRGAMMRAALSEYLD